ncbi:hypothetical protein ACVIGB_000560 [Bradyrhizobium sp. USDA 4341]
MKRGRRSHVWTPRDFVDLGTRTAVDVALHRMTGNDMVRRISRGLYDIPRYERDVLIAPDLASILEAVARRDGVQVLIDEQSAAQRLGLARGRPATLKVLSSGELEDIVLDTLRIEFRTVAPSRLVWSGRPASYLVQALRHIRKRIEASDGELDVRLREILADKGGAAIRKDLERGLGELPVWLLPHVKRILRPPRKS